MSKSNLLGTQYYWVYIILCDNNTYYTGYTNDLAKRYQSHINGTGGCKYTRSFKPIGIAQCWKIQGDKARAMQLERYIKKLSRPNKEKIIANPSKLAFDAYPEANVLNFPLSCDEISPRLIRVVPEITSVSGI